MKNEYEIESLDKFYELVNSSDYEADRYLRSLKYLLDHTDDTDQKDELQTDIDALGFQLEEGLAKPYYTSTQKDGSVYEYPSIKAFNQEQVRYLSSRLTIISNLNIRSRYAQVLYNAAFSNRHLYAKEAIESYTKLIHSILKSNVDREEGSFRILKKVSNLYFISVKTKHQLPEVKSIIIDLLFKNKFFTDSARDNLMILVLDQRRTFGTEVLTQCLKLCGTIYKRNQDDYDRENIGKLAIKLAKTLNVDAKKWHKYLAQTYEKNIDNDGTGIVSTDSCRKAIEEYKLAGDKKNEKRLLEKYADLKKSIKLGKFEHKFQSKELKQLFDHYKAQAKKVATMSPDKIYNFLAHGNDIFPNIKWVKEAVKKKKHSFMDYVVTIKYDINKNAARRITTDQDRELSKIYEEYHFYIQLSALHYLNLIFYYSCLNRKVNYRTLIEHLYKNTWLGKKISRLNTVGEVKEYNWLAVINPGLMEFFFHYEAVLFSNSQFSTLVLPIDSLTLKFEGMLRDFARMIGVSTSVSAKGNIREMYIEELLAEEKVQKYFDENDCIFFKYLFTSKEGLNMRNNVAHSFYNFEHYTLDKMLLVLMAILRLSKYQVDSSKIIL